MSTTTLAPVPDLHVLGRSLLWSTPTLDDLQATATPDQLAFLVQAMTAENTNRDLARRVRLVKRAGFPAPKSFTAYDWAGLKLPATLTREDLTSAAFVANHENLVCYGPVGTGKTHFAIAIGQAAIDQGIPVRFFTVSELVIRLAEAKTAGRLDRLLGDIAKAGLLVLDEYGYVPIDRDAARLLFGIIANAYETRSLIITTNLPFSHWGAVLTDDQLAAAMIDRIAHHGHLVTFEGDSYRMRHALMRGQTPTQGTLK